MSDSLSGLDFEYIPQCDVGTCENAAAWVGHPGRHRNERHNTSYVQAHMLCDDCKKMLESVGVLVCNTCRSAGIEAGDLELSDFYERFEPMEVSDE